MMSRQIKTIGIVGGLGPESTIEYYRQITARYREQIGDGSYDADQNLDRLAERNYDSRRQN